MSTRNTSCIVECYNQDLCRYPSCDVGCRAQSAALFLTTSNAPLAGGNPSRTENWSTLCIDSNTYLPPKQLGSACSSRGTPTTAFLTAFSREELREGSLVLSTLGRPS